jgi:hypothetical protein
MNALYDELEQYQSFLEEKLTEEVESVVQKGNELAVIIARSGFLMAQCKQTLNEQMQSEVMETVRKLGKDIPIVNQKVTNALIDSLCRNERFMFEWSERINRTALHQLEYCRTLISLAKQEKYNSRTFNT